MTLSFNWYLQTLLFLTDLAPESTRLRRQTSDFFSIPLLGIPTNVHWRASGYAGGVMLLNKVILGKVHNVQSGGMVRSCPSGCNSVCRSSSSQESLVSEGCPSRLSMIRTGRRMKPSSILTMLFVLFSWSFSDYTTVPLHNSSRTPPRLLSLVF